MLPPGGGGGANITHYNSSWALVHISVDKLAQFKPMVLSYKKVGISLWNLVQSTPGHSNLPLTRSNFHFPLDRLLYSFNFFLFPLKVRIT